MQKKLLSFILLCFFCTRLLAQYPDLSQYSVVNAGSTTFGYPCGTLDGILSSCSVAEKQMKMECPPWIIGGGGNWRTYFLNDGSGSYTCSAPYDIISNTNIDFKDNGTGPFGATANTGCVAPYPVSADPVLSTTVTGIQRGLHSVTLGTGAVMDAASGTGVAEIVNGLSGGHDWSRNYYGIWSAQYFNHPVQGPVSIGFLHAENKPSCDNNNLCPGTIVPYNPSYSAGPNGVPYNCGSFSSDYWPIYGAFVCGSWIPNTANTNWGQQAFINDMGPITWPSIGYVLPSGQKASKGCGAPTSIQYNGYMYVFYLDTGPVTAPNDPPVPDVEGRHGGIKVVRAPLSDALNPNAYRAFYEDPNRNPFWNPSLPPGFDKNYIDGFWTAPGPMATNLMGEANENNYWEVRFSVAQVRNTNYFIGIESYVDLQDNAKPKKALRFSNDLLHWTDRMRIIESVNSWDQSLLNYPILLGSDGWSNNIVDANDFYVVGCGSDIQNHVNKVHVYLPTPTVAPPPAPPCVPTNGRACPVPQVSLGPGGNSSSTAFSEGLGTVSGIYPNPNPGYFRLSYTLNTNAQTQVNVLDIAGRKLQSGTAATKTPGSYVENIDISSFTKGIYLVELLVNGTRQTFKVVYH